jgi:hypothetical protein
MHFHLAQMSVSWFSELISMTNELGVDLKCGGCISTEKQWVILWVGVSNQQPDLAMVTSVGIFHNFQRMSMSNHREVREVVIFEDGGWGGGTTITFNGIWNVWNNLCLW